MQRFTDELWRSIEPIFAAILAHPFLRGLTDGTLPEETFRFYVIQDALYLHDYARTLALAAAKAPRAAWCELFAEHAKVALVVEHALHDSFFREWHLAPEDIAATPYAPANLAYTSYLLRVAYERPFEEVLGAILPCYWIYWEVGKHLERLGSPNPLYQRWIDTYASEEYAQVVRAVIDVTDEATADLPESRRALVRQHFVTTSRYEWLFWDSAWRQETWAV